MSAGGRVRTILFTDVEASTELRGRRGDALADEILAVHEQIVRAQLERHGAEPVQFLGDGFMAAFAAVRPALECAVGIQRQLREHDRADPERRVRVRIGLHRGHVSQRDGQLYGQAVHAAARVTAEAAGGQVFVSEAVAAEAGDVAPLADRGLYWLKGFPQRWRLYEVQWAGDGGAAVAREPAVASTPFVARDDERADLRRWVDRARGGRGGLVLVSGEAGVGKTRLLQEVEADAVTLGLRVLGGHCAEMDAGAPYLPFVEILEQALVSPRAPLALRDALGDVAPEIARLVPRLRRLLPVPPAVDLPPEQAQRYLWNSVAEFLERASRDRPLLLVVEDLQWADEASLLLLEHLAPLLGDMPVLVCGTYRDTEVGVGHPLAAAAGRLTRRRLAGRIALQRLSRDGVAALLRGLAGAEPPDGLVRAIHGETDGNPFFVEEVYLHLSESGTLLDGQGRFRSDLAIDELDVPESIRLVVGGRLARLATAAQEALAAAAVLGRVFAPEVAARAAGRPPEEFTDLLDEAERARLVAPVRDDPSRLTFVHELIRQTLLAELSAASRQRLHARAADAVEQVHAQDVEAHAGDLAYHLSRAGALGDPERLLGYLRTAGERALDAAAFSDALAHFEQALGLVPAGDRAARAALLEGLGRARRGLGRWDAAVEAMDEALRLYEELGDRASIGRLCWTVAYHLAWAVRLEEAVAFASRGLAALGDLLNPDRARLVSATGWIVGLAGDYPAAAGMFAQARELAERLGDKRALADVLHLETVHDLGYARMRAGVAAGRDAAAVFDAEGALWDLCSVLGFVLYHEGARGRVQEAAELRARAEPLAERLGHLGALFLAVADRTKTDGVMAGDLGLVESLALRQIEVCEQGGLPWLYVGYLYLGLAAHWRGDWDEAERRLRRGTELEPPGAFAGQGAALLAGHLALAGRAAEVAEIFEQRRDLLPVPGQVTSLGSWNAMLGLTEALYLAGRREDAAGLGQLVAEALALGEDWVTLDCRLLRTRAGIAAAAAGRWDEAEEAYRTALAAAEALPARIEAADVLRLHALMLLDRGGPGDRERARGLLDEAARRYARLGMPRHEELARALAGRPATG